MATTLTIPNKPTNARGASPWSESARGTPGLNHPGPYGSPYVYGLVGNLVIARDTIIENYVAGSGDDIIVGNDADNVLEGCAGADVFVFGPADGTDTVTDFSSGTDKLDLTGFDLDSVDEITLTTGDDGVNIDLSDVDGGSVLLADITTVPETGDFLVQ